MKVPIIPNDQLFKYPTAPCKHRVWGGGLQFTKDKGEKKKAHMDFKLFWHPNEMIFHFPTGLLKCFHGYCYCAKYSLIKKKTE